MSLTSGTIVKKLKYRKYNDIYLTFGFTSTNINSEERTGCVLSVKQNICVRVN